MSQMLELNDGELIQLAKDIEEGLVFTTGTVPLKNQELLSHIFSDVTATSLKNNDIGLIYQYRDKAVAGVRIKGYPIFKESLLLSKEQVIKTFVLLFSNVRFV